MLSCRTAKHTCIWHSNDIDDELNLFSFVRAREEREPCEKFDHYASEGPHVDLLSVGEDTEHDVGRSVKPRLDVSVDDFVFETSAAEVCDGDPALVFLFHQNVLWFEVTVDDAEVLQVAQAREQLDRKTTDQPIFEALVVVHLDELVEVDGVKIEDDAEMVAPDEVVVQFDDSLHRVRVILLQ